MDTIRRREKLCHSGHQPWVGRFLRGVLYQRPRETQKLLRGAVRRLRSFCQRLSLSAAVFWQKFIGLTEKKTIIFLNFGRLAIFALLIACPQKNKEMNLEGTVSLGSYEETRQIALFIETLAVATGKDPGELLVLGATKPITLLLMEDDFPCSAASGVCSGIFSKESSIGPVIAYADNETCIARTSLAHELGHYFMWLLDMPGSSDHSNELIFGTYGVVANAEWAAWKELCSEKEAQ